jgi:hypothetical protein
MSGAARRVSASNEKRADIERLAEAVAGGSRERARQIFAIGERHAVHQEIQAAVLRVDRREDRIHLFVAGDVARQEQRIGERRRQLAHVFFEAFALIRQRERCALLGAPVRDAPGQ